MIDDRQKATLNLSYAGRGKITVEVEHSADDLDLSINTTTPLAARRLSRWESFKLGWRIERERERA